MSLEASIVELNANIVRNNALLAQLIEARGTPDVTVTTTNKPAAPKASAPVADQSTATAAPSQAPAPAASPAPSLTYPDVSRAILALGQAKGRDAAVKLLAEFGVAKGTELKPEQWEKVKAEAEARAKA